VKPFQSGGPRFLESLPDPFADSSGIVRGSQRSRTAAEGQEASFTRRPERLEIVDGGHWQDRHDRTRIELSKMRKQLRLVLWRQERGYQDHVGLEESHPVDGRLHGVDDNHLGFDALFDQLLQALAPVSVCLECQNTRGRYLPHWIGMRIGKYRAKVPGTNLRQIPTVLTRFPAQCRTSRTTVFIL